MAFKAKKILEMNEIIRFDLQVNSLRWFILNRIFRTYEIPQIHVWNLTSIPLVD